MLALKTDTVLAGTEEVIPDSVFVPHGVDFVSALHIGMIGRTFSSYPREHSRWFSFIFVPAVFVGVWVLWFWGKAYVVAQYTLHGVTHQTWSLPTIGFQVTLVIVVLSLALVAW